MTIYDKMNEALEARKDRSYWSRGVTEYARDLVASLQERAQFEGRDPETLSECKEWLLNGAKDWSEYSWGGCSFVYDCDIARALCTPSELKRTRDGARRPNGQEEWLDVQARALTQAADRVTRLYSNILRDLQSHQITEYNR